MFALVDCNNFYASCERVFKPQLRNKPVAILSNNDGCVISMSDETKHLQLPFGAPIFKWKQFCREKNIYIFSSNYPLYGDMSSRVMKILGQYSPDIEIYSIDEAFLVFKKPTNFNYDKHATHIRSRILKWTGIPTCVGVAPTKGLSKVANKIARSNLKQSKGICVIDSEEKRIKALKWLPIGKVWGIGRRLQKKLKANGCITAYDFTQLDSDWVRKTYSITLWELQQDLLGKPTLKLNEIKNKKSIATTRSFENTYSDIDNIKERISTFASSCAAKLRRQKSSCNSIIVLLSSGRHKKGAEQHRRSVHIALPFPTDSSLVISKYAVNAVSSIFKKDIKYKRAGVIVSGIVPADNHQLNFFETQDPKHTSLMKAIDDLNIKLGDYKIKLGNQDLERTWKMRQEHLSSRYTTHINELLIVT